MAVCGAHTATPESPSYASSRTVGSLMVLRQLPGPWEVPQEATATLNPQGSALLEASFRSVGLSVQHMDGRVLTAQLAQTALPAFPRDRAMKELSQATSSGLSPSHQTAGINEKM